MHAATFVLSTGRCGTQWLAWHLSRLMGPDARVEHEPLHLAYQPRRLLGASDPSALGPESAEPVLRHVASIEAQLERGPYVETGHPSWSALPYLAERLRGRLRVVHLPRHPLPTALSWTTHMAYQPPLLPHLQEKVLLSPFDAGVAFPEYQASWGSLTPFEKCLYYWAEVQAFALRQQRALGLPWLRLPYEALFEGGGLDDLHAFLRLPVLADDDRAERVDAHQHPAPGVPDFSLIARHPRVLEVAAELGYGPAKADRVR
ncbi:MAG TPA: hypothetical protein VL181_02785 [Holophagaceae bacterium]|nr:hypothetical protein [Holophagaceae bacterium]